MKVREQRSCVPLTNLSLRAADEGDGYTFDGIAVVYGATYRVNDWMGTYEETIHRRAFDKSAQESDVVLLVDHTGIPLARTSSGTLQLDPGHPDGLHVRSHLDASSPLVQITKSAMDRRDLNAMSISFRATRQAWSADKSKRDIHEAQLFDVSIVSQPASPTTSASLRSAAQIRYGAGALDQALTQLRMGQLDDTSRELLLQVLGQLGTVESIVDQAADVIGMLTGAMEADDATESYEAAEDAAEGMPEPPNTDALTGTLQPAARSALSLLRLRAQALDLK